MDDILKKLSRQIDNEIATAFLGESTSSHSENMPPELTFETLEKALSLLDTPPTYWYADTEWTARGEILKIPADNDGWYPEYHVINRVDFQELVRKFGGIPVRMRHIREWRAVGIVRLPVSFFPAEQPAPRLDAEEAGTRPAKGIHHD